MPASSKPKSPTAAHIQHFVSYLMKHAHGKSNAKTAALLIRDTQLAHQLQLHRHKREEDRKRQLRNLINAANHQGEPICSGNTGYFYPSDPTEAAECLGRLASEVIDINQRRRALEKALAKKFKVVTPPLTALPLFTSQP